MPRDAVLRRLITLSERIRDTESIHEVERLRKEQDKLLDRINAPAEPRRASTASG